MERACDGIGGERGVHHVRDGDGQRTVTQLAIVATSITVT